MAVTPTDNPLSMPTYLLQRMVALSATFQAACAVSTAADANARIHRKDFDFNQEKPVACIGIAQGVEGVLIAGGSQNQLRSRGSLFLYLARETNQDYYDVEEDNLVDAENFFGGVLQDIQALSGQDQTADTDFPNSHLAIVGWRMLWMSENPREEWGSVQRFWHAGFQIDWGDSP